MLRHKLNVMSPTDFHLIAEAQANNSLMMGDLASPISPMMLFQQDLNQGLANLEAERQDAVTPAIAQAAAAAAAAAGAGGFDDEHEEMTGQHLDRGTRSAAQFNQDEDHYEGDDETSSSVQGSSNNSSSNVTTRRGSSSSSRKYRHWPELNALENPYPHYSRSFSPYTNIHRRQACLLLRQSHRHAVASYPALSPYPGSRPLAAR